jgi:hypothetical protein
MVMSWLMVMSWVRRSRKLLVVAGGKDLFMAWLLLD